jgi:hypothetical protein
VKEKDERPAGSVARVMAEVKREVARWPEWKRQEIQERVSRDTVKRTPPPARPAR